MSSLRSELPDSLLIDLDERDAFPEELVRRMSSGDELGIQLLFVPFEYGGMGGGAFDVYRVCERMAAIDLGLATSELATFLGIRPDQGRRDGGPEARVHEPDRQGGSPVRLRRHGARGGQRPRGAEDDCGAGQRERERDRLSDHRGQAVDQQRRRGGPLHDPGPRSRRAELVRGRIGRRGLHARQARGQARHPAEQHGGAVSRQGLRRRRSAGRGRRGPGPRPGPAGVRLHEADGGRVRTRRGLGGARPRDPLLPQAHPGRGTAVREGGLHAQADRPSRGRAGSVEGRDRGDRRAAGCGRGCS